MLQNFRNILERESIGILIKLFTTSRKSIQRPKLVTTRPFENESFLKNFIAKAKSDVPSPFESLQHNISIQQHPSFCRVILHTRFAPREINKSEKKVFINLLCEAEKEIVAVLQKLPASVGTRRWNCEKIKEFLKLSVS